MAAAFSQLTRKALLGIVRIFLNAIPTELCFLTVDETSINNSE